MWSCFSNDEWLCCLLVALTLHTYYHGYLRMMKGRGKCGSIFEHTAVDEKSLQTQVLRTHAPPAHHSR